MKTFSSLIFGLLLIAGSQSVLSADLNDGQQASPPESISVKVVTTPAYSNLLDLWITEFQKQNPTFSIESGGYNFSDKLMDNQILLLSEDYFSKSEMEQFWKMEVGMEAVVPVIAATNPLLDRLEKRGMTISELSEIVTNPEQKSWNLFFEGTTASVELVVPNQDDIRSTLYQLVGQKADKLQVTWVNTSEEMLAALEKNKYALGICRANDLMDRTTHDFFSTIKLLPMDKNRNGRIDYFEQIYADAKSFVRGVWIGKFPDELCFSIFVASNQKPTNQSALEFLKWMNSGGQQLLSQNGFAGISSVEKSANLEAMIDKPELAVQTEKPLISRTWLMVILAAAAALLILIGAVWYARRQKLEDLLDEIDITPAFNENSIQAPKGIYFDKTHTWAFMEQNGFVKVGIDDFLQHVTGTITRIRMKESGEKVRRGEKIMTIIRNGKQMDIYSPVSGVIREQNQSLLSDASMVNKSPYSEGWVYLIEPKNWLKEMQFLFMAGKYKNWLQDEFTRLKDFLAASMKSNTTVYAHVVLQDGGELTDHVLADLGPEVWEDFQTNFIDTSK